MTLNILGIFETLAITPFVILPPCHCDEWDYAKCRYAECHYAECCGATRVRGLQVLVSNLATLVRNISQKLFWQQKVKNAKNRKSFFFGALNLELFTVVI